MDAYTLPCDCCGARVDEKTLVYHRGNYLCPACTIIELEEVERQEEL